MNQNILFADREQWDEARQAVNFPALQGGQLITCWVTRAWLEQFTQRTLPTEAAVLAAFGECRFDLEEDAEALIEDEAFNQDGDIEIG